jgi:myo-inositol-1(or 4)-monophosphatase
MTTQRLAIAKQIAKDAGELGLRFFRDIASLDVQSKGVQDHVSNADLEVETFVRSRIAEHFPKDGIVGEEHGNVPSSTGWTWVIDPIDGTANFIAGIPQWCTILACVQNDQTQLGVIYEPSADEMFWTAKGQGAFLNVMPISVAKSEGLNDGSIGVGMYGRTGTHMASDVIAELSKRGGIFFRNASGGLMLAYVAAGRLIGYTEAHMNAWDCLTGQLLIAEAGGRIEEQSADTMLINGGRVIAACPDIYDELLSISAIAFK